MTEAVILVPGIMGSVLKHGDKVIWPGSPLELLLPYKRMKELLNPNLVATDVIRSLSIVSQYKNLIEALNSCGFEEGGGKPLVVFPYDWRKDNAIAAQGLADCIDVLVAQLGQDAEINLLAHSMGGLVSRCYLESGQYAARPGFPSIKSLITIGTPHRGTPVALAAALGQEKRLFLSAKQVMQVASDQKFPSLYQLLPPKGEPFAWDRAHNARFIPVDIYDNSVASKLNLVMDNLKSAMDFHAMLDLNRRPAHVRYFFFTGTHQTTTSSVQLQVLSNDARVHKVNRDDAGDGTVPIWSASQSGVQMEPVGGEHGELYKNGGLQRVLAALLGKTGVLMAAGAIPEISVSHKVLEPGATTRVTIDFPRGTVKVEGVLRLSRMVDGAGVSLPAAPVSAVFPITYTGAQIDHLSVLIEAPELTGIYKVAFVPNDSSTALAETELFVQAIEMGK